VIFVSFKANARVYDAKSGHGPHSLPPGAAASRKCLKIVANLQFATEPVWAQNPDNQQTNQSLSLPILDQCHIGASL